MLRFETRGAEHPFLGIIKAETQGGFRRDRNDGGHVVQYLSDLFLTPASKLYKIGMFVRQSSSSLPLPDGWAAHVYDSNMTQSNRDGAAKYFYEYFLGCRLREDSARLTRLFFDETREFIRAADISLETKTDLVTSLYTYLKVEQASTISARDFADRFLPQDQRDLFTNHLYARRFPQAAIAKDITEIKNKLRLRKIGFAGNIRLTAPPEAFAELIEVESIPALDAGPGRPTSWTRITIRDHIQVQE